MMPPRVQDCSPCVATAEEAFSIRPQAGRGRPRAAGHRIGWRWSRGGAALPVVLATAFVLALIAAFAHANLLVAQRLAARDVQSARASEAAEAGLAWALARLNAPQPVDSRCEPTGTAAGHRFRDSHAGEPPGPDASASAVPPWPSPSPALQPACRVHEGTWRCACPAGTLATLDPVPGDTVSPGFRIRFAPHPEPGLLSLTATGCSDANEDCLAPGPTAAPSPGPEDAAPPDPIASPAPATPPLRNPEARAHRSLLLAHLPALARAPAAALTVHGGLTLGSARWELTAAAPPLGGVALHTGAPVHAPALRIHPAPGKPVAAALLEADASLTAHRPAHRFAQRMRMGHADWQTLPTVRRINCESGCDTALVAATAPAEGFQMIWLEGGLRLSTRMTLGSAERPVLLVSNGPVELLAPVRIHGLVYSTGSTWRDDGGAEVMGAVVAEGHLVGTGTTHVRHDPAALALLARTGTFVRVPGSWKDFP